MAKHTLNKLRKTFASHNRKKVNHNKKNSKSIKETQPKGHE